VLLEAASEAGMDADRRKEAVRTIHSGLDRGADGEAWYPDDLRLPKHTTVPWAGKVYSLTTGRPIRPVPTSTLPTAPAPAGEMAITFFAGLRDTQGRRESWTWEQVAEGAQEPLSWPEGGKEGLPLWSWAVFEDDSRARRPDGLHADGREKTRDPHIESVSALVLDYDDDPTWSLEAVRGWWGAVRYVAHTSAHHLAEKPVRGSKEVKPALPRGRVILALSRPVLESEWDTLARWVLTLDCGVVGEVELKSPRRAYYIPASAPGGYASEANLVGTAIDVDAVLKRCEVEEEELEQAAEAVTPIDELLNSLSTGKNGEPRDSLLTVSRILEEDPRWSGRLRWSEFTDSPNLDGATITDEVESECATWLENVYGVRPPTTRVHEAMRMVARRHTYHPVREYLDGLVWDGVERLDHWLGDIAGATGPMDPVFGAKWLIACVARIFRPGCKVDTVPILRGGQGAGKSSLIMVLGGDWFRDSALSIGDKDGYQQLRGAWLYELGELDSVSRREWSTVKAFITSQIDEYRPSYGRNTIKAPRQTVFVGTTNETTFLGDSTGSRRFWVIEVGQEIRVDRAREQRDQLWAEAVARFRGGAQWWLTQEEEEIRGNLAGAYQSTDPWADVVEGWLITRSNTRVTLAEVASGAVGRRIEDLNGGDEKRLARLLTGLGWGRAERVQLDGKRAWRWEKGGRGGRGGT
jgi:hypothetical protein